ncbi:type I polyketide synthase [Streptomyces gobiensis]|uniref:type I polyketide synthase n=1 Tax=Streptomyces gobiensis TaxID=2875706 RepID=UPI001E36CAFE|nr:type I polyketide synthase [Streptomyces gobiensis]UGY94914.1 SDR family NAD(P)-dependent oxidoreductase [Streptomyces gobiensis]
MIHHPPRPAIRDLVVALTPFEEPSPRIAAAAERAGALGLLDLGRDADRAHHALAELSQRLRRPHGVRVPAGCPVTPDELPAAVDTVLLAEPQLVQAADWAAGGRRRVWAEVTSLQEARAAVTAGAAGIVVKGHEAGGRVGELTTFVLLHRVLADPAVTVPVLAAGGIGPHTAAAAAAGGAAGVVLDAQLALTTEGEAHLPGPVAAAVRAMDGTETTVVAGYRVYTRPDLERPEAIAAHADADGSGDERDGQIVRVLGARSLRTQVLPIGQEGAFAARLAARHRTTGGVVQAVRAAIAGHLDAAVRARPLQARPSPSTGVASGQPGAAEPPLPVAQGPMTRVSDQAAFAVAVADAGGLPFLALAVMDGPQVRRLLGETAERLTGRPWGVGLLGFAPPELRRAQLAAVAEVRPPYAIIAGGRPDQAAPLEAAGTRTYLHVPSPGLLDRFLAEGTRRFVFEGMECGGHIGPRASFPLWEEQIERLLACDRPAELDVLFAGGVHDERSAAMAAAAAAPLAERGARVGVLMGTAYLFTEEAVAAGAVLPGFQQAALHCDTTVLLRTAPGHATRCAATAYADAFAAARRRLEEGQASPREVWEELEKLNLGRLRIASKGLRHTDSGTVPVGEDEQRREGLYMLGQAATARTATTTLAALHTQVTDGATAHIAQRAEQLRHIAEPAAAPPEEAPLDIAVIGMACCFPGAGDLASYWSNIVAGADAVTDVPADRWDPAVYHDPAPARAGERTPSRWGGFLPAIPFDALAHGIPPASLAGIEPVQLLALEVAARALSDAGYGGERHFARSRTSVVFGAEAGTELAGAYGFRALHPSYLGELPPELDAQLPRLTEDSFPGVLANVIAGRVANRLDLGGANRTLDAACASSLAALDLACKELRDHSSDMVLCGGADVHNGINDYLMFASVQALSPTGRCRPFDAAADGITLGEGVACLALKRLEDAERDGDRVYAVVKSVGAASDGRSLGLTAPRPEGQRRALERAYRRAGTAPADVGLIEAHGTGTVVGDRTELAVLTDLFTAAAAEPGSCALGSVKSQLGHTKCAAGLAGLIKAARAIHAGVRPPTLHLTEPGPAWRPDTSPFFFDTEARPWTAPVERRVAGVSAFGFGGTNFHAVLAGYPGAPDPAPAHGLDTWPAELLCFRGHDRDAAARAMARLAARLERNDAAGRPWPLRDLAAETAVGEGPVQAAVVATDLDDLAGKLARARDFAAGDGVHVRARAADPGRVAFLFPGQGSQRPGMLGDLFIAFPPLQRLLYEADRRVVSAMFPPAAFTPEERAAQRAAVTDTRIAQPALGLAGAAVHTLLTSLGVRPHCTAGHSYGELVALWAAGAFATPALLRLSARRAETILTATGDDPGTMAAVTAAAEQVRDIASRAGCVVANHNAPRQCVLSGPTAAVDAAVGELRGAGLQAERLRVACAFHSPVVASAADTLAAELAGTAVAAPAVPVWSNTTAQPYGSDPAAVRGLLARQVAEPVRFAEQVEAMYEAGVRTFVEAGPGRALTGLVGGILGERPHTAVACDVPGEHGLTRLVSALAELAAAGVPVDPEPLFKGRAAPLPDEAPRRPGWLVDGHLVRTAEGEPVPGGLRPARRVTVPAARAPRAASAQAREETVLEYLRGARELVAAQRDVLLGYLGAAPAAPMPPPAPALSHETNAAADGVAGPVPSLPQPQPASDGAVARPLTPDELMDAVLEIIHARTGYPRDMLGPGLDLEADLSVDSIKRVEIIGALADRIGLPQGADGPTESAVEELARIKTISGIVDWIAARGAAPGNGTAHPPGSPGPQPAAPSVSAASGQDSPPAPEPVPGPRRPDRHLVEVTAVGPPRTREPAEVLAGRRFTVVEDGLGVALALTALLESHGADVRTVPAERPAEAAETAAADGVVDLGALRSAPHPVLPEAFEGMRRALAGGVRWLLLTTGSGGEFGHGTRAADPVPGAGLRGFARTAAIEYPGALVRAVDIDPKDRPERIAAHLLAELCAPDEPVAVGYTNGTRNALRTVPAPLPGPASPQALPLDRHGVVLLTGGARGITARTALALARATGCHIELTGRTPQPAEAEDPATAHAHDRIALRAALIAQGLRRPPEIEAAASRILAAREVRATLAALSGVAASVRYHTADVTDAVAVRAVVEDVRARHGRLDGLVHGAGVLQDKLLCDKDPASFAQVFRTKVDGARHLAEAALGCGDTPDPAFLVLFGSVAGVFGNRGQADYAAANDALDTLAHAWSGLFPGRVVAVDWGPWAAQASGMVTPELERTYARRGIALINPDDGTAALLAELAHGREAQVVLMARQAEAAMEPAVEADHG